MLNDEGDAICKTYIVGNSTGYTMQFLQINCKKRNEWGTEVGGKTYRLRDLRHKSNNHNI